MQGAAGDDLGRIVVGGDDRERDACAVFAVLRVGIAGRDAFRRRCDHGLAFAILADFIGTAVAVLGAFGCDRVVDAYIIDALLICSAVACINAFERVDAFSIRAELAIGAVVVVDAFRDVGLVDAFAVLADFVGTAIGVFGALGCDRVSDAYIIDALLVCVTIAVIEAFERVDAFSIRAELAIGAIQVVDAFCILDALIVDAMLIGCAVGILEAFTLYDANIILANLVAKAVCIFGAFRLNGFGDAFVVCADLI